MTVQAAAYELSVDWDRDGYFCQNVPTTDPLNLIPRAATMAFTSGIRIAGGSIAVDPTETTYGLVRFNTRMPVQNDGVLITLTHVPLAQTFGYTLTFWVFTVSLVGSNSISYTLDDGTTTLATGTFTAPAAQIPVLHQIVQFTFTAASTTSSTLNLTLLRAGVGTAFTGGVEGLMVTSNPTLSPSVYPVAFNTGSPANAYEQIFAYTERIDWTYGCTQYSEAVAPQSSLTAIVKNIDGVFTPSSNVIGAVLSKGALVRMRGFIGTSPYSLYIGTLDSIRYDAGSDGERHATLNVIDPMPQLLNALYAPALQQNVTTDQVLQAVFDSQAVVYPYPGLYWILGAVGFAELGTNTFLVEQNLTNFEVGATTFTFAGDITGADASLNAQSFIREYVYAEMGRFFYDAPTGQFKFFNRNHDVNAGVSALSPGAIELDEPPEYLYGDDVYTQISLNYYPRVIGTPASILYPSGNSPLTVVVGQPHTFTVRYQDPNAPNAVVAGKDMITPVAGVDYIANAASDGSGADKTSVLQVVVNFLATSAQVTLINNNNHDPIYVTTFQLRGTPLKAYTRATASVNDGVSLGKQGDYRRTVEMTALGDDTLAASYANYLLQRYKTPTASFRGVSIWGNRDDATLLNCFTLGVGSYVQIDDAFLANSSNKYIVTAFHHTVTPLRDHWTRLFVEPLDRSLYWILGDPVLSVLGTTTRLNI